MNSKRYDKTVALTLRLPEDIRRRARETVERIRGDRISVPGTDRLVKPSISALALRGLVAELDRLEPMVELRNPWGPLCFLKSPDDPGVIHVGHSKGPNSTTGCCGRHIVDKNLKPTDGPVRESSLCPWGARAWASQVKGVSK